MLMNLVKFDERVGKKYVTGSVIIGRSGCNCCLIVGNVETGTYVEPIRL
jgi:hypothetical protein